MFYVPQENLRSLLETCKLATVMLRLKYNNYMTYNKSSLKVNPPQKTKYTYKFIST